MDTSYPADQDSQQTTLPTRAAPALPPIVLAGWRGFVLFAWVALIVANGVFGLTMRWGLGPILDFTLMALLGFLFVSLFDGIFTLLWKLIGLSLPKIRLGRLNGYIQALPGYLVGRTVGIWLMVFGNILWPDSFLQYVTLLLPGKMIVLLAGIIGALIFTGRLVARPAVRYTLFVLAAVLGIGFTIWLVQPGTDGYLAKAAEANAAIEPLNMANPGLPGPFAVRSLSYGSGDSRRRPEYGENAALITPVVDGSSIFGGYSGFAGGYHQWYNGFDFTSLPLNGLVWYPEGEGPFPLVLIVHGNHGMTDPSDPGYAYLGEHLASRGFITASVDENFLNGFALADADMEEMPLRAWLLLKHLEQWRDWNETPGNPFYGRVDMEHIGLIGHSRGGEAVAHAAVLNTRPDDPVENGSSAEDFGFGIRGIVALAPCDNRYRPDERPIQVNNADYLLLAGAHDQDMFYLDGLGQYTRANFDENPDGFKAIAYLYRANHGNFNTVWGDADQGEFESVLLNREPLLAAEEQQQAAKVFITGFLEASVKGHDEYRELFYNTAGAGDWLPDDIIVTQYRDANFLPLATNNRLKIEEIDLAGGRAEVSGTDDYQIAGYKLKDGETTVGNRGLRLEWVAGSDPAYAIRLPENAGATLGLTSAHALSFNLVDMSDNETPPAVMVELATSDGVAVRLPLAQFAPLPPPLPLQLTKAGWIAAAEGYEIDTPTPYERLPQTFDLPLASFVSANPDFRPEALSTIRVEFNSDVPGAVMIDDFGFRTP